MVITPKLSRTGTVHASIYAPAVATAALVVFLVLNAPIDPDAWWHIATGNYLATTGQLPTHDIFTASAASWVLHEWATQWLMFQLHSWGGWQGLYVLFALPVGLAMYYLVALQPLPARTVGAGVAILSAVASAPALGARPQMVTLIGLALFLFVLEQWRRSSGTHPTRLAVLPLAMLAWANMHSGYLVGLVVLAIYTAADVWRGRYWLAASACATVLASLATPYGIHLWLYPLETLTSETMRAYIQEWQPPRFDELAWWPFFGLATAAVATLARARALPAETWLLIVGSLGAALMSGRHVPLFGVVCIALLPLAMLATWPQLGRVWLGWEMAAVLVLVAAVGGNRQLKQIDDSFFPVAAVEFLAAHGAGPVPIYNEYGWGGYLIYHGFIPRIDGRADVHGAAVETNYMAIRGEGWQDEIEGYQLALLRPRAALGELLHLSGWQAVYTDATAVVWRSP